VYIAHDRLCKDGSVTPGVAAKVIGACSGLTAFAVAMVAGLAADNTAEAVLSRALVAMIICNVLGWFAGLICERTVRTALDAYTTTVAGKNAHASAPGRTLAAEEVLDV